MLAFWVACGSLASAERSVIGGWLCVLGCLLLQEEVCDRGSSMYDHGVGGVLWGVRGAYISLASHKRLHGLLPCSLGYRQHAR